MADDSKDRDKQDQTEDPTAHRLEEARKRGQIPISRELGHWALLAGALVAIYIILPFSAKSLMPSLFVLIQSPHTFSMDSFSLGALLRHLMQQVLLSVGGVLFAFTLLFLIVHFAQTRFNVALEHLSLKWDRISPISGFKRIFSMQAMVEFLKGFLKVLIVGAIIAITFWRNLNELVFATSYSTLGQVAALRHHVGRYLFYLLLLLTLVVIVDYAYQRFQFLRQMRMTRQEIKEEHRELEGNPEVKAKLKQIRTQRAQQRLTTSIPQATVVITNPTHYAVALQYHEATMHAPKILAKGLDDVALFMRELAHKHQIPIVRNPPLARQLYKEVKLDATIEPRHYKAVAEVIKYVMHLNEKKTSTGTVR